MTRYIIGADEVGRGCVAGDVFVAAVMVPEIKTPVTGVRDSKKLSPARREAVYTTLVAQQDVLRRVARRTAKDIDARGIAATLRECFDEAVCGLIALGHEVAEVRIDGNPFPLNVEAPTRFIVKGDDLDWVIGAASIVAKVERDRCMDELDAVHPGYGFAKHKGYGTPEHIEAIRAKGLSPLHRATFCRAWTPMQVFEDPNVLDLFG